MIETAQHSPRGLRLSGHIDVPAARLAAVTAALPDHIRLSRAEPGCLLFDVTPDPARPGRFNVSERFVDRAAFEAHQARVGASDWGKITEGLPRSYRIEEDRA
ncbi:putative quinol monooxygenase [Tropicimonas sp. IMCC34043]|uniref:putative quinol monooxygenase n=1 Tax=Tropicimonas sp. IMCC34043 TaxID=2248760 RepID=UPI000E25731C|nr:antibiotic biosynthesis monooxygenase [Tropicimonas sp. IMCC34043]